MLDKAGDLNHSKPLDVHVWAKHPEVNSFVDSIYEKLFSVGNKSIRKKHLKVILLDLYVTWCNDPDLKIGVSFNHNAYKPKSRYNELHISKRTIDVVRDLETAKLIEREPGKYNPNGKGRISRIWPSETLIEHFKKAQISLFDIGNSEDRETIILKNIAKEEIEYEDDDEIFTMRAVLRDYNNLLKYTYIDIPCLDDPYIDHGNDNRGKPARLHISQTTKFVYRVFNRGSFDKGGRFYGGWWQSCPKKERKKIYINDEPTVEIDYSGFHIVLLYALEGISYPRTVDDDPYVVEQLPFLKDESHSRNCAKKLLLVAFNAKDEKSTFQAFRDKCETGSIEKKFTNKQLSELLTALKDKHEPIKQYIAHDAGIELMNLDAQISEHIIKKCTDLNIPVLTIHDSFIVQHRHDLFLSNFMDEALRLITEQTLGNTDGRITKFTVTEPHSDNTDRSPRYAQQLMKFRGWLREEEKRQRNEEQKNTATPSIHY